MFSFVEVCSQAHVLRPCRHPFYLLLCRRTHLAETRQRDKLRSVSCLSGSSSALPAWARLAPEATECQACWTSFLWQAVGASRLALLMHRRTLTKIRLRTPRMACCGPSQRNAPSAMRAALLSAPGFAVSLHAILTVVSRSVSASQSRTGPRRATRVLHIES